MDVLPDELAGVIMEILPDSRPLGLSCRRFYAVFCGLPDVAYWCSGGDPTYLLPKMVPEVWCGSIFELVRADNVALFTRALLARPNPDVEYYDYLNSVYAHNAVEIFKWLNAKYKCYNSVPASSQNGYKIIDYMCACAGVPSHNELQNWFIFPGVLGVLYKWIGPAVKRYKDTTYPCMKSLLLRVHTLDDLVNNGAAVAVALNVAERIYPLPHLDGRKVIKYGTLYEVKSYLHIYKKSISSLTLAHATSNRNGVFVWLYTESGLNLPSFINAAAAKLMYFRDSDVLRFFHAKGFEIPNPLAHGCNGDLLELALDLYPERVKAALARGNIPHTTENVHILVRAGINFAPTSDTLEAASWDNIITQLRIDPSLAALPCVTHGLAYVLHRIDYHTGEKKCAELAKLSGEKVADGIIAAAKVAARYIQ